MPRSTTAGDHRAESECYFYNAFLHFIFTTHVFLNTINLLTFQSKFSWSSWAKEDRSSPLNFDLAFYLKADSRWEFMSLNFGVVDAEALIPSVSTSTDSNDFQQRFRSLPKLCFACQLQILKHETWTGSSCFVSEHTADIFVDSRVLFNDMPTNFWQRGTQCKLNAFL